MHFNVLNLETRLKKLESLRDSTENINRKIELSRDIQSLKAMINYVSGSKYKILEGEKTFDDSLDCKTDELASFLSAHCWDIYKSLYCYTSGFRLPWRIIRDSKIEDREYFKLLESFLSSYDKRLFDIYNWLKEEERIELCPKKFERNANALGLNIHLTSLDESYVLSRWNNKISSASILPHELGHAFLMNGTNSTKGLVNKHGSIFFEAYSIFLELIFFDFLKNTKYSKNAIREEYYKLDGFIALVEHHYGEILTVCKDELLIKEGKTDYTYSFRLILSNVLAMYFADLYRNDRKNFVRESTCFFEMLGYTSEEDLLSHFGLEKIVKGSKHVVNEYMRSYKYIRSYKQ